MMKQITRINHIGLRVRNFEIARDFYAKLGFEYITGPSGSEPVAIVEHPTGVSCFIRDPDKNVIEFIEYIGLNAFKK
ncbi:VOC family protein [Photobacterium profundum]|uniref:VOC family protein n=1 Tax=Photobacterium profundum TaxID=74109 RepID=UPI0002D4C7BD|nr:VOC family protein [Photobacterium profundum]